MRIIAGKFKGSNLYSAKESKVRPTTDATKEKIFSIVGNCQEKRVLDLFAGFGGLGLEALSRGAKFVQFVDASQSSLAVLRKNIAKLQVAKFCKVAQAKVDSFLNKDQEKFDIIFLDPPYDFRLVDSTLAKIAKQNLLQTGGIIVVEQSPREELTNEDFTIYKSKTKGNTKLTFLENHEL